MVAAALLPWTAEEEAPPKMLGPAAAGAAEGTSYEGLGETGEK